MKPESDKFKDFLDRDINLIEPREEKIYCRLFSKVSLLLFQTLKINLFLDEKKEIPSGGFLKIKENVEEIKGLLSRLNQHPELEKKICRL